MFTQYSILDLKYYFQKNKKIYISLLFFFLFGIVIGIIISISSDSYLSLLSSKDKVFFDYVNGKVDFGKQSVKLAMSFLVFQVIVFCLNLNYYLGFLTYILVTYQTSIMYLSLTAIIAQYGFGGVMNSLFIVLPVNLVLIASNILFSGVCIERSYYAMREKRFSYGFDNKTFWVIIAGFVLFGIVFSYLINFLYVLILKRRVFIIF